MGSPAARMGDMVKQDAPHCHAPIHPPAPTPTPVPHPALQVLWQAYPRLGWEGQQQWMREAAG